MLLPLLLAAALPWLMLARRLALVLPLLTSTCWQSAAAPGWRWRRECRRHVLHGCLLAVCFPFVQMVWYGAAHHFRDSRGSAAEWHELCEPSWCVVAMNRCMYAS